MEKDSTFNPNRTAQTIMQPFLISYLYTGDVSEAYVRLRDRTENNIKTCKNKKYCQEEVWKLGEYRKIIERCRDFFKDISLKRAVDKKIEEIRAELGDNLTTHKMAEKILSAFSDEFWGDGKRKYNMSNLATTKNIPTITNSNGQIVKAVKYVSFEDKVKNLGPDEKVPTRPTKHLIDKFGNDIFIQYLGTLYYSNGSVSNEYVQKYRITRKINDEIIQDNEVFSEFLISDLNNDRELAKIVASELLSTQNINHSYADGYIGNITTPTNSHLEVGKEKESSGYYRYQITPKHSLEYDGEKIEAVRALKEKDAIEQSESDKDYVDCVEPDKDEEPEI